MRKIKLESLGKSKISITKLPKIGDRDDFEIRVVGPDHFDYKFSLSITGSLSASWDENPEISVRALAESQLEFYGEAKAPMEDRFSFDTFNSADTLKETLNNILTQGVKVFTLQKI